MRSREKSVASVVVHRHQRANDEANTFVAKSASKLAAVEDEGPRWPGVSPKASATLAALRLTKLRINSPSKTYSDVSTLTEVCSRDELPEVEIISLLTEQIPKYTLRADTLTEFGGYENQDWFIPSAKVVEHDESLGLTPEQIRETLNYFSEYKRPFIFIINL
ncbi:hypothetical protein TKK_0013473 [Trichogramma kaykai]